MTEDERKKRFAQLLYANPGVEPLEHANVVLSVNPPVPVSSPEFFLMCMDVAQQWPSDDVVWNEIERLKNVPPTRDAVVSKLYAILCDKHSANKDKVASGRVIGQLMGWAVDDTTESPSDLLKALAASVLDPIA